MRINPIMVKNHYSPTQKINFGMIENKKTEELTYNMMMEEVSWYDEDEKQDPDFGYKEAVEYIKQKLDYFKTSPLFTLKSKKNVKNEDVLYVVMDKNKIDKHEHRELFNKTIEWYKNAYDPSSKDYLPWCIEGAQKAGLPGEEKGFLRILDGYQEINGFYMGMQDNEHGIIPESPKPTEETPSSDEKPASLDDDKSYQAYIRYGV